MIQSKASSLQRFAITNLSSTYRARKEGHKAALLSSLQPGLGPAPACGRAQHWNCCCHLRGESSLITVTWRWTVSAVLRYRPSLLQL